MPVLPSQQPIVKELTLPSGAKVKIDLSPALTGDLLLYTDADNMDARFMKWLVNRLAWWDFTEKDGSDIPITLLTIQRLPKLDYHFLYEQHVNAMNEQLNSQLGIEEKKSSSSTLTPSETPTPQIQG